MRPRQTHIPLLALHVREGTFKLQRQRQRESARAREREWKRERERERDTHYHGTPSTNFEAGIPRSKYCCAPSCAIGRPAFGPAKQTSKIWERVSYLLQEIWLTWSAVKNHIGFKMCHMHTIRIVIQYIVLSDFSLSGGCFRICLSIFFNFYQQLSDVS